MTIAEMQAVLARFTYRPGWRFELYEAPNGAAVFRFGTFEPDSEKAGGPPIEVVFTAAKEPDEYRHWDREFFLRWIHQVVVQRVLHEVDEWLRLDGKPLHEPHPEKGWTRGVLER